jgi:hypothetical protein
MCRSLLINARIYSLAHMWPVDDFLDVIGFSDGGYVARS